MLVKKGGDDIPNPTNSGTGNDPEDTKHNEKKVVVCDTLNYSVNSSNDVERGDAKDKLNDPRKIVDCLNKILHFFSPKKILALRWV